MKLKYSDSGRENMKIKKKKYISILKNLLILNVKVTWLCYAFTLNYLLADKNDSLIY